MRIKQIKVKEIDGVQVTWENEKGKKRPVFFIPNSWDGSKFLTWKDKNKETIKEFIDGND